MFRHPERNRSVTTAKSVYIIYINIQPHSLHMEIELKLLLPPKDAKKLLKLAPIRAHACGKPKQNELFAAYFDTPDLALRRHDAGLRVRKENGRWVQTMKAGGSILGGLHQRHEWEVAVDACRPDLKKLYALVPAGSPWSSLVGAPSLAAELQALFSVQVVRTSIHLRIDGDEIELALDQGTITCGEKNLPVSEVELELKSGNPQSLYAFALRLLEDIPLRLENRSKAERGYALHAAAPRSAFFKAEELVLPRRATVEQGLCAVLGNCLTHIQKNEAGLIEEHHPESLHQMRVGLRRLRSAFKLFEDMLALPPSLQEQLAWLGNALGPARDWEVLSASTLKSVIGASAAEAQLQALQDGVEEIAGGMLGKAARAVASPRYTQLLLSFFAWMQASGWRAGMPAAAVGRWEQPLESFAAQALEGGHRKILDRGKHMRAGDPHRLHRLRIACKRNRYAAEFFHSLYPAKRMRRYVAALADMQDELGWRNDAAVAAGLLDETQEKIPHAAGAAGFAKGYLAALLQTDNRKLRKAWKKFRKQKPPFASRTSQA